MTNLRKLEIHDEYKESVKEVLKEAMVDEPDSVIVMTFFKEKGIFKIKTSGIPDRLRLIGSMEEAKNKIMLDGYAD
jgi:hypothetical protein